MKPLPRLLLRPFALAALLAAGCAAFPVRAAERTNFGQVAGTVVNLLMEGHYSMADFDDKLSAKALQNYFDTLDYNRMYFTRAEIDRFRAKYETQIDDYVLQYKLDPANEIYALYSKKVQDRLVKIKAALEGGQLKFDGKDTVEITRKDAPWAESEEELDALWIKQLTREVLQERIIRARAEERKKEKAGKLEEAKKADEAAREKAESSGTPAPKTEPKAPETPEQKVLKRYERLTTIIKQNEEEDISNLFLSAIATSYDPHSEYFSAEEQDRFTINMRKSLTGIGAVLSQKDGAAEIRQLVPGGPADKGKQLKVGDLVLAVGEGVDGEMKDVEGLKLQKIVEMIRGPEGTTVRLKVQPAADPTTTREILIQRAKVEIKDTLAKAELIEMTPPGTQPLRVGWIDLDEFYADMENMNKRGAVSATRHVEMLLTRLQKEGINGLVLDLRGNGGGALEEAIRLTGLFVKAGPVVQQRNSRNQLEARFTRRAEPVYTGPLIVLTDRLSASASEICAAALQDTGRAVIMGDKTTFGKGTVQTIVPVADSMPLFSARERAGSLKVTIQKFYRINGYSTQKEGVSADIPLPSRYDAMEVGERYLKDPLPYDKIPELPFEKASTAPLPVEELRARSAARVKANPEFNYIQDYVNRTKELLKKNTISLNEAERLKEERENEARLKAQREERKKRTQEANKGGDPYKVYPITVDTVNDPKLKTDEEVKKEEKPEYTLKLDDDMEGLEEDEEAFPHGIEPVKAEALNVMRDLIELTTPGGAPPASTKSTAKRD